MKKLFTAMFLSLQLVCAYAETPVQIHGLLQVKGNRIVDEHGKEVQLRGMSLFWSQWKGKYYTPEVVKWLVDDWNINVIRVAMAVDNGGYATNKNEKDKAFKVIQAAVDQGIYVIVDFHVHNAVKYESEAVEFFSEVEKRF